MRIALIDNGVDRRLVDCEEEIDFSRRDMEQSVRDEKYNHGTVCAGIIAKYAPSSNIISLKAIETVGDRCSVQYIRKANLLRCGTGRYIIEQAISSSIVGGLALMAGPALSLALLSFKFPIVSESFFYVYMAAPEYNASFSNLVRAQHYYLYLCAKLLMVFMFGATMNMIAFAVSTCTKESFVIAFTPFILIQSTTNLTNRAGTVFVRPAIYLHGNLVNLPFDNTCGFLGFVILVHLIIALICLAVSNCILRRRVKYA